MSTTPETIERLKRLVDHSHDLISEVDERLVTKPGKSKRVPYFGSESFVFTGGNSATLALPSMNVQERVFVNGGEDIHITGMGFKAYATAFNVIVPNNITPSGPINGQWINCFSFGSFDFEWNYRVMSDTSQYLSTANNVAFSSRTSLGYAERGKFLEFLDPLTLVAGDALAFSLRLMMAPSVFGVPVSYLVDMIFVGYRDGVLATPEYAIGRDRAAFRRAR